MPDLAAIQSISKIPALAVILPYFVMPFVSGLYRIGRSSSPLEVGRWQMLTATYNGKTLTIYKDGKPIATRDGELATDTDANVSVGMPDPLAWGGKYTFQGQVQDFTIRHNALTADEVKGSSAKPNPLNENCFHLLRFNLVALLSRERLITHIEPPQLTMT